MQSPPKRQSDGSNPFGDAKNNNFCEIIINYSLINDLTLNQHH